MAYDPNETVARMKELMKPIDQQIMMCDDIQDLLALASIMLVTAKTIYINHLGISGAKEIFESCIEDTR